LKKASGPPQTANDVSYKCDLRQLLDSGDARIERASMKSAKNEGFLAFLSGLQVEPAPGARNDYARLRNEGKKTLAVPHFLGFSQCRTQF
jgi:hypothetical protein